MTEKDKRSPLSGIDAQDAARRSAPSATVVFEAIRQEAVEELARPNSALFWSGLAAGLSMGFSFIAEALLRSGLPEAPWQSLISKFGYSVGFMIVILGRQQLFTENTLTPVVHVLREGKLSVMLQALRLWGVVLGANILGTLVFGIGLHLTDLFDSGQVAAMHEIAEHTVSNSFATTFVSAILAGWLIALMVWLLPAAETARVAVIIIITYLVGLGSFSHIIAGSTVTFYALAAGTVSFGDALNNFFVPTLIGNIVGGVGLVAALNYAQVSPDT